MPEREQHNPARLPARTTVALAAAGAARWASRTAGRGKGSMIGGLIAEKIDPQIMSRLAAGKKTALITGTNGKSTTTRMTAAALAELGEVATQADGANMDAGIIATLSLQRSAPICALEVDELHVPHVSDAVAIGLSCALEFLDRRKPLAWRPDHPRLAAWLSDFARHEPAFERIHGHGADYNPERS